MAGYVGAYGSGYFTTSGGSARGRARYSAALAIPVVVDYWWAVGYWATSYFASAYWVGISE